MEGIRVNSWNEILDLLYVDAWRADLKRFRSPYVFRGNSKVDHQLETSLVRLDGDYADKEAHLLRNFRKYARSDAVEQDSIWNWLSLAKHHGLPSRLLDWSFSPFVALHFATDNLEKYDQDSSVCMVDFVAAHQSLPEKLLEDLGLEGSGVFTAELLSESVTSLQELNALAPPDFVIFFEPPSIDERIVNQFALFSIMSRATASLSEWLSERPDLYNEIIIPAELKWEVRDKLDQANVTERVLFPGLDGVSAWLKRHYTSRK